MGIRVSPVIASRPYFEALQARFSCRRCGRCCTEFKGVKVTKAEIRALGVPRGEWGQKLMMVDGSYALRQPCPFYDPGQGCLVYERRPSACRKFPMHTMVCTDGWEHLGVTDKCEAAVAALASLEAEVAGNSRAQEAEGGRQATLPP
jgi:Fe-S-cluster containining protein